jgi:NhaA family Na+:H+ antiporter
VTARRASPPGRLTRYLGIEVVGGVMLALAAIVALVLANSPWAESYASWLAWELVLDVRGWTTAIPLRAVVDEGLMTVFFFSVGLEIRRELHAGELAEPRRAALPFAAAVGGMVMPAVLYLALNPAGPARHGWGVAMATDIAFAVAALALLGRRVAPAMRVLLLAIAILDDIGGVLVIAVFYSEGIAPRGIVIAVMGLVLTLGMLGEGRRHPLPYVIAGVVMWIGLHHAGVHPTMAGVVMGLLIPPRARFGRSSPTTADAEVDLRSPSERLQTALHPWVALVVMPLFALANAGVAIDWQAADTRIAAGILAGLVVGKPLGIVAASWIAVRLRLARMPHGVGWSGVVVVGLVAGVGFTVALFIANLAFADPGALASAKLGILGASVLAVVLAVLMGRLALPRVPSSAAAATAEEAECHEDR